MRRVPADSPLLVVTLAVLLALSGCSALSGSSDGNTATPELSVDAPTVVDRATQATRPVDSYETTAQWDITVSTQNRNQTIEANVSASVDRAARKLKVRQEASLGGRTFTSDTYLVNGTVYQHSELLARTFDSEWIRVNVSDSVANRFDRNDELGSHRAMLANATVELNGTDRIDGQRAYRLEADVNETAMNAFYGYGNASVTIENLETTVWVGDQSDRILRADGTLSQSVTAQGQRVQTSIDYDVRFRYTAVDVTLPEAASAAVPVNQTTGLVN